MQNRKVSIHMCTYNRAQYIRQAIDSVLTQTFRDWELLIVDDASTDTTEEIVHSYTDSRIVYIKNEVNLGITKNRNKALSLSQGEYVAVLDSDDYWTDTSKIEKQVAFLDQNIDYALIGTHMSIVDEDNAELKKIIYPTKNKTIHSLLLIKNLFCHSSVVYRKKEILELGGYNEQLPIWEDYDLWLRIGLTHKVANLPVFGTAYRKHGSQSNTDRIKIGQDAQKIIIEKYKNSYSGYWLAKCINFLRNTKK